MADYAAQFLAERRAKRRAGIKRQVGKLDLLSDPAKMDKLVASFVREVSPSARKGSNKIASPTDRAESVIPKGHPFSNLGREMKEGLRNALIDPQYEGMSAKEISLGVANTLIAQPGKSGRSRIDEAHLAKMRSDTSMSNFFGVFGEDKGVRAAPGYERFREGVMAQEIGETFKPLHSAAVGAATGAGFEVARRGVVTGLAKLGVKRAATWAATAAAVGFGPGVAAAAAVAVPMWMAYDAISSMIDRTAYGKAWEGTIRKELVELGVGGVLPGVFAGVALKKAFSKAAEKSVLSAKARNVFSKFPSAKNAIATGDAKRAANEAEDIVGKIIGKEVDGEKYRDLVHGALLKQKGGGRTYGATDLPSGLYGTENQRETLLAATMAGKGYPSRGVANAVKRQSDWARTEAEVALDYNIGQFGKRNQVFDDLITQLQTDIAVARQALPSEVQSVGSSIRRGVAEREHKKIMKELTGLPPGMIHPGAPKAVMKKLTDEGFEVAVLRAKKKGINTAIKEVGAEEEVVKKIATDEKKYFNLLASKLKRGKKVYATDMQRALLEFAGQYIPLREMHGGATSNLLRKAALQVSKDTGIELNTKTILKKMTTDIYDISGIEVEGIKKLSTAQKLKGIGVSEGSVKLSSGEIVMGPKFDRPMALEEVHATLIYAELHHIKGLIKKAEKQMFDNADHLIAKRGFTPEQAMRHHSVSPLVTKQAKLEEQYASMVKDIERVLATETPHYPTVETEKTLIAKIMSSTEDIPIGETLDEIKEITALAIKGHTPGKFRPRGAKFPTNKMLTTLDKVYGKEATAHYNAAIESGVDKVTAYKNAIASTKKGAKALEVAQRRADRRAAKAGQESTTTAAVETTQKGMTAREKEIYADKILRDVDGAVKDGSEGMFKDIDIDKLDPSKILGAILIGAASIPLAGIFAADSAEAADFLKIGTTVSRAAVGLLKDEAKSGNQLLKELHSLGLVTGVIQPGQKIPPAAQEGISLATSTSKLVKEGSLNKKAGFFGFGKMSPHAQARMIFSNNRNAITELGTLQNAMGVNIHNNYGAFANIMKDVPGFRAVGNKVQKVMAPLADRFSGEVMAYRTVDLKLASMQERLARVVGAKVKPKHAVKTQATIDKMSAEVQILEDVHAGLKVKFDAFNLEWTDTVKKLAVKNASTRMSLAAEDTAEYATYPWLKGMLTKEEELAVGHIKNIMETYKARVSATGKDVIAGPYMHHAWHPNWNMAKMEKVLERNGVNIKAIAPFTKFHSRHLHSKQMVPDIAYNFKKYVADTERRLQWTKFWGKKKPVTKMVDGKEVTEFVKNKEGWWAHMHSKTVRRNKTLSRFWEQVQDSAQMTPGTMANEWANRYQALETLMLLGFSPSTAFKHAFKNIRTWGMIGFVPAMKHIPEAAGVAFRNSVNYGVINRGLAKLGIKGKMKKKSMDDFVKAITHQHGLTNAMVDMEVAPVSVGGGFMKTFDRALQKANEVGSVLIQAVESYDRAHTALATMSMAAKKGMTAKQAAYSIHHTIIINNFLGNALNPQWARDPKIRAIFLFQNTASKIMEGRVVNAIKAGRSAKGFFGVIRKQDLKTTLDQIKNTQRDMKAGGSLLKQNLWADFKQSGQEKSVFDTSYIRQFVREATYIGLTIGGLGSALDANFWPHTFHLPFFKETSHGGGGDPTIAFSPFVNSLYNTVHHFKESSYDADVEYDMSDFIDDWLGTRGAVPLTFSKAIRISENDIPEIYRNSKMKYLFAVPDKRK